MKSMPMLKDSAQHICMYFG